MSLPVLLHSRQQSRAIDAAVISSGACTGIALMKRAAAATLQTLCLRWPQCKQILVLCGGGNNGGDGYILAGLAAQRKMPVRVIAFTAPDQLQGDAARAFAFAHQEGVEVSPAAAFSPTAAADVVVVDAIYGTGFRGALPGAVLAVLDLLRGRCPVLAVDLPSGLCADTGVAAEGTLAADLTLTFITLKPGLLTMHGPSFCGELMHVDLDVPHEFLQGETPVALRLDRYCALKSRPRHAHKGDQGHLLVVGGELGLGGAALLAAESALAAGAGLVSLATQPVHVPAALARLPEVMCVGLGGGQELLALLARASCVLVGPGLGQSAWSQQLLLATLDSGLPLVLDADALNLIAAQPALAAKLPAAAPAIMTPHPGEAARLLDCSVSEVQRNRLASALALRDKYHCAAVLKGAGSVIADEQGVAIASVGNPGMAVAGMGDVLAGLAGALLAQGLNPSEALRTAVCAHGWAGDRAAEAGLIGLRASMLMPHIRRYLSENLMRAR